MSSKQKAADLFDLIKNRQTPAAKLPKGFGKASELNSEELTVMLAYHDTIREIERRSIPMEITKPASNKNYPNIDPFYTKAGMALEMCPHELKSALVTILESDNPLIIGTLKKLLATAKIADERTNEAVIRTKRDIRFLDSEYERRMKLYEENELHRASAQIQKTNDLNDATKGCMKEWKDRIERLAAKLKTEKRIENLGDQDRWFAMSLQYFDIIVESKTRGTVTHKVVMTKALNITSDRIAEIIGKIDQYKCNEREAFLHLYLHNTPTAELRALQWQVLDVEDRHYIQDVLEERRMDEIREEEDRIRFAEYRHNLYNSYSRKGKYGR